MPRVGSGVGRRQMILHLIPFRVGRHSQRARGERRRGLRGRGAASPSIVGFPTDDDSSALPRVGFGWRCGEREAELASMIDVEIVVTGEIGVKDELLDAVRCVEQNVQTQGEVVEKVIRSTRIDGFEISVGTVNFHFVLGLEEFPRRRSECGENILNGIPEENAPLETSASHLAQFAWSRFVGEERKFYSFGLSFNADDVKSLEERLTAHGNGGQRRRPSIVEVIACIDAHLRHRRRRPRRKGQRTQTSGKAWLKFRLYWEGERETPEVENEYLFFGVEDARVRGAERGVDLFDGRRHRRRRRGRNVKVDTTIPEFKLV